MQKEPSCSHNTVDKNISTALQQVSVTEQGRRLSGNDRCPQQAARDSPSDTDSCDGVNISQHPGKPHPSASFIMTHPHLVLRTPSCSNFSSHHCCMMPAAFQKLDDDCSDSESSFANESNNDQAQCRKQQSDDNEESISTAPAVLEESSKLQNISERFPVSYHCLDSRRKVGNFDWVCLGALSVLFDEENAGHNPLRVCS